jgi:hypothetical protein
LVYGDDHAADTVPGQPAINQSLLALDEGRHVFLEPIRPVAKGFLHIDGAKAASISIVQIFHVEEQGPFSEASGLVVALAPIALVPSAVFRKRRHSALVGTIRAVSGADICISMNKRFQERIQHSLPHEMPYPDKDRTDHAMAFSRNRPVLLRGIPNCDCKRKLNLAVTPEYPDACAWLRESLAKTASGAWMAFNAQRRRAIAN